jgi:polyprenyl-phospho-N-acetylgalactosaminyl synthase
MHDQISHNSVFILIPIYNEGEVIKSVIEELLPYGHTIVIIDDGSSDNVKQFVSGYPAVRFIRHKVNLGQGSALQTGIDFALKSGALYIVTFDGDGQHSATDLPAMLSPLQNERMDITLASRFLKKNLHNASRIRKLILKMGCFFNYVLTGIYLSDAHNGLRAMTKTSAEKIRLKENRMAHATEFLLTIRQHHLKYKEVPATLRYTEYSKQKGQSLFESIRIVFDLILHKLFE